MDYTMEDSQNSAPDALEATKLNASGQRTETQSVTKRLVGHPFKGTIALRFPPMLTLLANV
jgi:hypothetical protein